MDKMGGLWANAGDVFFTHGDSVLSRLIRWAETDPKETNGAWANHTGLVVNSGWLIPPLSMRDEIPAWPCLAGTVEALGTVTNGKWWEHHKKDVLAGKYQVRAFRSIPPLTPVELDRLREAANEALGQKYGWWKLFAHLADRAIFKGRKVFSTLMFVTGRPICSFFAARAFEHARPLGSHVQLFIDGQPGIRVTGWAFGMAPQAADPDEMMDYCLWHPDEWKEVETC